MRALLLALAACAHDPVPAPPAPVAPVAAPRAKPASGPRWVGVAMAPGTTRIERVFPGSPASAAGLAVDDELISVDGVAIADATALRQQIAAHPDGAKVALVYRRAGATRKTSLVAAPLPDTADLARAMIGKPAPAFALATLDGKTVELAQLRGRPVLLDFWATWCRPCAAMRPQLDALATSHPELVVVAISSEDAATQMPVVGANPGVHAIDPDGTVELDYLTDLLPTLVSIDARGTVTARAVGLGALAELHLP